LGGGRPCLVSDGRPSRFVPLALTKRAAKSFLDGGTAVYSHTIDRPWHDHVLKQLLSRVSELVDLFAFSSRLVAILFLTLTWPFLFLFFF
jgi:hypothetical protein